MTTTPTHLSAADVAALLPNAQPTAAGFMACCPAHEDRKASLAISTGDDGRTLLHCHAGCSFGDVVAKLKLTEGQLAPPRPPKPSGKPRIVAEYTYRSETGIPLFQVCRMDPKSFRQRQPKPGGGWLWTIKGCRKVPYRLPQLLSADPASPVVIVEGEKDADRLAGLGLVATTNAGGAGKWPDDTAFLAPFAGHDVAILPDNDAPGRQHAALVAERLHPVARSVRIVEIEGLPPKGDVSDWLDAGHTVDELRERIAAAPVWSPSAETTGDGPGDDGPPRPLEADDDPHRLARLFLEARYQRGGVLTLRFHRGEFLTWSRNAWRPVELAELKGALSAAIKAEFDRLNLLDQADIAPDKPPPHCHKVTRSVVENATLALQSLTLLPATTTAPAWIGEGDHADDPADILAMADGLLHLPSAAQGRDAWRPPTPELFTPTALDYDFDPDAACPTWREFLASVWPDDPESIATLQTWFGYCLTDSTKLHKLLMLIGPPRSGKGTIGRVMRELLGAENIAAPTLGSLADQFGLASLVGKRLAIVADARLSGRADAVAVVERLLSITGEDPQDVQRKHQTTLAGVRLPVKFTIFANELPNLRDTAGALLSRTILLRMPRSFAGREDRDLERRLLAELPGILTWSIEGWRRLTAQGELSQPASARELLDDLEDLASPVGQFIRDCCIVGPEFSATIGGLFKAWEAWCQEHGRDHVGTEQAFGRDLRAALPQLLRKRFGGDGARQRGYDGVGLKSENWGQYHEERPLTSASFSIARDGPSNSLNRATEAHRESSSCNANGRGRADVSTTPRLARPDMARLPPWVGG